MVSARVPTPVRHAILGLALAAAVVAGCGSSVAPSTSSLPDSVGSSSPLPTPELADPLAAFEGRLRDATTREGQLVRALAAASAGGPSQMRLAVIQMRQWIDAERTWLGAHPGAPCFATAVAAYQAAIDAMTRAADGFAATASRSPTPSGDPDGAAAGQALQDAARALTDSAVFAKNARSSCR